MSSPWTLGAGGLSFLTSLYYISWRYVARWVCRLLLRERVVFSDSIKTHDGYQNGKPKNGLIVKEIGNGVPSENTVNHEVGSRKNHYHTISDSGTAQRQNCAPYVVTEGILAEISQL